MDNKIQFLFKPNTVNTGRHPLPAKIETLNK